MTDNRPRGAEVPTGAAGRRGSDRMRTCHPAREVLREALEG